MGIGVETLGQATVGAGVPRYLDNSSLEQLNWKRPSSDWQRRLSGGAKLLPLDSTKGAPSLFYPRSPGFFLFFFFRLQRRKKKVGIFAGS